MPGRLVLCATPVGNLEDVTLRVLRCLRECDVVFAEDTRISRLLLDRFDIKKPLRSFHERVASGRLRELAALLSAGKTAAVMTDAGTPGIADPGTEFVRAARAADAAVEVLPGASAVIGALVLSGFDVSRFRFEGFPPRGDAARREHVAAASTDTGVTAWYEAPTRVRSLLADIESCCPERAVFVLREYTKKFEQQLLGTASDVLAALGASPRGEFVVVLDGAGEARTKPELGAGAAGALAMLLDEGVSVRLAVEAVRRATGLPKKAVYAAALDHRRSHS
ncbi:MAG TPA: 16S rRNA (cytidine(1402)-2'-O)-methyltransferase [Candidatus Eremiobacteraceae bacterium]|nr:16S rRNA (cytidine(1402)-2'-O)-methyltransferase [Candidatus Eremiobacteraceae bacterium]